MKRILIISVFLLLLLAMHRPILFQMGQYLVVEDAPRKVDALYVLSGNPGDRGKEAAKLHSQGFTPKIICLGGETTHSLELYGIHELTATQTQKVLQRLNVPEDAIQILPKGSSTFEEYESIVADCKSNGYKDIMIVSSRFHTRRIHAFFRHRLLFEGINLCLRGAPETAFSEKAWWKDESGLLFVNNEYIKMAYYFLRY